MLKITKIYFNVIISHVIFQRKCIEFNGQSSNDYPRV